MGLKPCKDSASFTQLLPGDFQKTLIGKLAPCIDRIRDINTQLGLRPYVVRMVRTRWSGGLRGEGVEEVISETPLLPTPKVEAITNLESRLLNVGNEEFGTVKLSEISLCFTEAQLLGLEEDGSPIPSDQQFYYEIEFASGSSGDRVRRRFQVQGIPAMDPGKVQWEIDLVRAQEDRTRDGTPQGG